MSGLRHGERDVPAELVPAAAESPSPSPPSLRLWGGGWAGSRLPGVLSHPWSLLGDSSPAAALSAALAWWGPRGGQDCGRRPRDAGPRLWTKAPAGFRVCGTSLQPADLKGLLSAGQCRLPGPSHSLPQDFPGPALLYGSTPLPLPCVPLALCLLSLGLAL